MLVSFDIKFIRRVQKQRRNGEACRAIRRVSGRAEPDKLDIRRRLRGFLFIMLYKQI